MSNNLTTSCVGYHRSDYYLSNSEMFSKPNNNSCGAAQRERERKRKGKKKFSYAYYLISGRQTLAAQLAVVNLGWTFLKAVSLCFPDFHKNGVITYFEFSCWPVFFIIQFLSRSFESIRS